MKRINSIDFLRGITIILMIQYHIYIYWTNWNYEVFGEIILFLGFLAAPFFLILSGISFPLLIHNRESRNLTRKMIFVDVFKRALFIFIVSTLFQIVFGFLLSMSIQSILYWSVFQVISFAMIIFFLLPLFDHKLKLLVYIGTSILIFLLSFIILYFDITLLAFLVTGTFPLLPWIFFYLFGLMIGDLFLSERGELNHKEQLLFIVVGIGMISVWILGLKNVVLLVDVAFFTMAIGIFLIIYSISYYLLDAKERDFFIFKIITRWGKFSFSIYYIQFGIIGLGLFLFPMVINEIYTAGFLMLHYLLIIVILFIGLEIFIRIWEKFDYNFGIEWFMSKFTQKSLFSKRIIDNSDN